MLSAGPIVTVHQGESKREMVIVPVQCTAGIYEQIAKFLLQKGANKKGYAWGPRPLISDLGA